VQEVEFVDEAVAFEEIEGAVDSDAVDARVEFLSAIEDRSGVEVALGVVHDLENNFSLAGEADAALGEGIVEAAGAGVGVDAFAGGDAMGGGGRGVHGWKSPASEKAGYSKPIIAGQRPPKGGRYRLLVSDAG
jgi:hypothetical protein